MYNSYNSNSCQIEGWHFGCSVSKSTADYDCVLVLKQVYVTVSIRYPSIDFVLFMPCFIYDLYLIITFSRNQPLPANICLSMWINSITMWINSITAVFASCTLCFTTNHINPVKNTCVCQFTRKIKRYKWMTCFFKSQLLP